MGNWALISILDPARTAQYAAVVETYDLAPTPVRSLEEAVFFTEQRGPAALLIVEIQAEEAGFALLEQLRTGCPAQDAPALVVSNSWAVRDQALKRRAELRIAEVLAGSQPMPTVGKAVWRALQMQAPKRRRDSPSSGRRTARSARSGEHRKVAGPLPVHVAPIQAELFARGTQPDPEIDALDATLVEITRQLGASMTLAWIKEGAEERLQGHFGWDRSIIPIIGSEADWAPFRNLAMGAPIQVSDVSEHKVLARSMLVRDGTVGSFAGAPLVDVSNRLLGALCIAHREAGAVTHDLLEPLTLWAQLLAADLGARSFPAPPPAAEEAREPLFQKSSVPVDFALQQLAINLDEGLVVTDNEGRITFANPVAAKLFGLRNRRVVGLLRKRYLDLVRLETDLPPESLRRLAEAGHDPLLLALPMSRPARRIIRWETRCIPLDTSMGRLDHIRDVTREEESGARQQRLVRLDELTWLENRAGFNDAMAKELARSLRQKSPVSLVLFSIDQHDQLEPPLRDLAVRDVAWLLYDLVRGYDHAARIDQQTLAAILPGAEAAQAVAFATRFVGEVADLTPRDGRRLTLSAGIAQFDPAEDVDQLVARARAAMLEASNCGGNGVL